MYVILHVNTCTNILKIIQKGSLLGHDGRQNLAARIGLWFNFFDYDVGAVSVRGVFQLDSYYSKRGTYQIYHNLLSSPLASLTCWKEKVVTYLVFIFQ